MGIECICNGYLFFKNTEGPSHLPFKHDEDGYMLCPYCGKIDNYLGILASCDICDRWFKGFKKYPRISYTCEDCENDLSMQTV